MKEDLFKYLNKKDGTLISDDVKKCWYEARAYVLHNLPAWEGKDGIGKDSSRHLEFVIGGTSTLMLSVVRQIALSAHYTNFNDADGSNATVINIPCNNSDKEKVEDLLRSEECVANLYDLCNENFIDVSIRLVDNDFENEDAIRITEDDVRSYIETQNDDIYSIDTRRAQYVNMVYNMGCEINNLPPDDPNTAKRYNIALDVFCYQQSAKRRKACWNDCAKVNPATGEVNQFDIRKKLSNVFCADCFDSRIREIKDSATGNLEILAKCEHSRWVVERLVLGFAPFSKEDMYKDEEFFGKERREFRKKQKKAFKHIDLCSYRDLKRLNPGDMKYDCFLMLAIPHILSEVKQ